MRDLTSKKTVLLLAILGAVVTLVASGRPWVTGSLNDGALTNNGVQVTGSDAAPGLFGIVLVAVAGLLAAATSGRIARWVAGVLSLVAALFGLGLVIRVLADPDGAVKSRMGALTGHTGEAVAHGTFTFWIWIAVFASALTLIASILGLLGLRRWAGLSSRYEAPTEKEPRKASDWDLMNEGIDPTADDQPDADARTTR